MRFVLVVALLAVALAAPLNPASLESKGGDKELALTKTAGKALKSAGVVFYDKDGKQIGQPLTNDADFTKVPSNAATVVVYADPTHINDKFIADANKFATEHKDLSVTVVNSGIFTVGTGKSDSKGWTNAPKVNFVKLAENLVVLGVTFNESAELTAFIAELEKDVGPEDQSKKTDAPVKKVLLEIKEKLGGRTTATTRIRAFVDTVWPANGYWKYWHDNTNYPNHHITENTGKKTWRKTHSTENGQNRHYWGYFGVYNQNTPTASKQGLKDAFDAWYNQ